MNQAVKKKTKGQKKFEQLISDLSVNTRFQSKAIDWLTEKDDAKKDYLMMDIRDKYGISEETLLSMMDLFIYDVVDAPDEADRLLPLRMVPKEPMDMCHTGYYFDPNSLYPVTIRIHRFAAQKDVIDYVKKNWKTIKENIEKADGYQEKSIKIRRYAQRDNFIYKNRNLRAKKILDMLRRQNDFPVETSKKALTPENIRKIIEVEKKRRLRKM